MSRPALALALFALLLSGCASNGAAPTALARGPGMAEMHVHPLMTTFSF